ncbi:serine hydrolase [Flavobacterium alkalisoli]|uniref:Serine hydrolase n=1 Tax=Flavobacterium alkalisoli TaxID=2602769 RepID=A0A5B9FT64_9FLAO|nr:serine hydrolase [Flavobacterium alkalisoli]QEE50563.1 serine hydrolase [Flavobacterium alkalisoli]
MKKLPIILSLLFLTLCCVSCKVGRFVYYNLANITDYKIFPSRPLVNDSIVFHYYTTEQDKAKVPKKINYNGSEVAFDDFLADNKTVAFLIIKNDTIQYEKYFNGYEQESIIASFSMAKSVTSILIGCALDDGFIKSVDEPVVNYVPELKDNGLEKVTIKHLLQMSSGIKCEESYINPFGDAATYYYGTDLRKALSKMKPEREPGTEFSYSSCDTQLLGLVLERSLKGETITEYLDEKIWKPLGMEYDASWSLDREKNGLEKTFCCINARARDFSKIGRLYLNKGNWNGKQIVSENWVEESTKPDTGLGNVDYYKYQWWLSSGGSYMAKGLLGQFIYVYPSKDLIIVRLGKNYGEVAWPELLTSLAENY